MSLLDSQVRPLSYENFDLKNVVTPVRVNELKNLLQLSGYPHSELDFVVNGFRNGFDIGYEGPQVQQSSVRTFVI